MRPAAAPLACLLFLTANAYSQSNWQKVDVPSLNISAGAVLNSVTASGGLVLSSVSGDPTYKAVRSTDGGATWETPPLANLAPLKLKALNTSFLYGARSDSNFIMTNINQGVNPWTILRPALNMTLADVHYINSSPGQAWAVGDSPYVSVTSNNWGSFINRRFPNDSVLMTSVHFFDNNFGVVAGRSTRTGDNGSVIFSTNDGGVTWQNRSLPDTCSSAPNLVVDFLNPRIGWAAQTCNTITNFYKTTDSGATWANQGIVDLFFQASAIDAVDSLHAWVVGRSGPSNGSIVRTSNGGASWNYVTIPSSGRLLSITMKDTTTGFACGQSATLLVYSPISTDVKDGRTNRPRSFELSQNYPNPFNGQTRILFTLQKSQPVTLTVYNLLGQPVRKLVDETRPAGKNEISWDGRDERGISVPSGIYLYKLNTTTEKQIRKMVLLK
ncbi:MAG TPA: T9SS type A sorting domain-containing protein [Verrucomicrobiae bacterium]|nr:T9SS type A sorting domain-containing protein [Verrucomicrobiae bacterium]